MSEHRPVPNLNLEREQAAFRELGETQITPRLAWAVVALFALTLAAVPALELVLDRRGAPGVGSAFALLAAGPLDACALAQAEAQVEERSEVGRRLRHRVQLVLTNLFGFGNEQVYAAPDGWLFQRAGFDYATGPPFLAPQVLARRVHDTDPCEQPPDPDPRPAILRFHADLAARGIDLVVLPTPVKAVVDGRPLGGTPNAVAHNPSFDPFVEGLRAEGVAVFDPTRLLVGWKDAQPERSAYLATDTHWRPEAMEAVARELGAFVEARFELGDRSLASEHLPVVVENRGDLAALLELEPARSPFSLERATIQEVRDADGRLWKPLRNAPVLLLGDSFSTIFAVRRAFAQSEDGVPLDWGESAGLAEQLSHVLGRPVDRIARNAGGAHATRRDLARDLARRGDRLDGVRVVVWQFAVRELSQGDWPVLPLPAR